MVEIADFVQHAPVPSDVVDAYRDRVPAEIVEVWEQYGYGTFADGFVRVIDPAEHERRLEGTMGRVLGPAVSIPLMVTGLADVIAWEPELGLTAILHRNGRIRGLGSRMKPFFGLLRKDPDYLEERFDWSMFPKAVEAHGPLAFDESFIFVPLLGMGGAKEVANMQKRDTITGVQIMVEFQGVIEH